jgi:hypothetical protein
MPAQEPSTEDLVIVPGFTPVKQRTPIRLHPAAAARVREAVAIARRHGIARILLSGGAVYPEGTPYVEAEEMAAELRRLGWPEDAIVVEPTARHTTTNLRNAGRIMRARGWGRARVVTDFPQSFYLAFPGISGFHARCQAELGYLLGVLGWAGRERGILFAPGPDVERLGPDARDP